MEPPMLPAFGIKAIQGFPEPDPHQVIQTDIIAWEAGLKVQYCE
jgi:hypothetical protein